MQRPPLWIGFVLLVLLLGSVRARCRARARGGPPEGGGAASFLLADELDPRRASVRSLRALPGVGETIARRIASTRRAAAGASFGWEEVPGIGPGRARELRAWLRSRALPAEPFGLAEESYLLDVRPLSLAELAALAALATGCGAQPSPAPSSEPPATTGPRAELVRTFALDGIELSVVESQATGARAVVLLHGARYSRADWLALGTFAFLAERGVRVLALDWPGSGASPRAAREPDAGELLAALLTAAGIERAVLVGPSRGGAQALALAARGEARLAGLFLLAPAGTGTFEPAPEFRLPIRLLWGADDDIVPLSVGREFAARLPGARLEVLPGRGHACYREDPARFHAELTGFLSELGFLP